jgi:hypothetical protein
MVSGDGSSSFEAREGSPMSKEDIAILIALVGIVITVVLSVAHP